MASTPGPGRCEEVLRDIIQSWRAGRPNAVVAPGRPQALGPVLFSNVSHTLVLTEALLALRRQGLHLSAMPLVRQIIEFSVRSMWLERYPENIEAVLHDGARQRLNAIQEALKTGVIDEMDPVLVDAQGLADSFITDGATSGRSFERLCDELVGARKFYWYYRMASNVVHPSIMLSDLYLEHSDHSNSGIALRTNPDLPDPDAWLRIATSLVILGALAWDRVDRTHIQRASLQAYAIEFEVPRRRPQMTAVGFQAWSKSDTTRRRRNRSNGKQGA